MIIYKLNAVGCGCGGGGGGGGACTQPFMNKIIEKKSYELRKQISVANKNTNK